MTAPKIRLGPNYSALCDAVEKHDPKAAKWMRNEGARMKSTESNRRVWEDDPNMLSRAFVWGDTPQDIYYWLNLDDIVGTVTPHKEERKPTTQKDKPLKWEPIDLREMWGIGPKTTRARILEILLSTEETLNAYGRENVRLKNKARRK